MDNVTEEFILVILVIVVGVALFGFVSSYLIPTEAFSVAQQQAASISSSSTVSVGPLLINNGEGSAVVEFYNPSFTGNVFVVAFVAPSSEEPSFSILTPSSLSFSVYLPNGNEATQVTVDKVYDVSGRQLTGQVIAYEVPVNVPVTVKVNGVSSNDIIVVWFLYNSGNYFFRVGVSFTGVPSS